MTHNAYANFTCSRCKNSLDLCHHCGEGIQPDEKITCIDAGHLCHLCEDEE